ASRGRAAASLHDALPISTSCARCGRAQVPSIRDALSPSPISRGPSAYRREGSWRTYPLSTRVRMMRWMVGSGSPEESASWLSEISPPASAMIPNRAHARSSDCTPPALARGTSPEGAPSIEVCDVAKGLQLPSPGLRGCGGRQDHPVSFCDTEVEGRQWRPAAASRFPPRAPSGARTGVPPQVLGGVLLLVAARVRGSGREARTEPLVLPNCRS